MQAHPVLVITDDGAFTGFVTRVDVLNHLICARLKNFQGDSHVAQKPDSLDFATQCIHAGQY